MTSVAGRLIFPFCMGRMFEVLATGGDSRSAAMISVSAGGLHFASRRAFLIVAITAFSVDTGLRHCSQNRAERCGLRDR